MLIGIKKLFRSIFSFLSKLKTKDKKVSSSKITSYQDASVGFLLNTYNNINNYNITIKSLNKNEKIKELENFKRQLQHHLDLGEINEIQDIKSF